MMGIWEALAWTVPPSIAAICWAVAYVKAYEK